MEVNIYWITALLVITYPITVALLLGRAVKFNGKDKAILFTGDKDVLPVNLQAPVNYDKKNEEKISQLEEIIKQLREQLNQSNKK